uniref:Uncharacterized protein n=1 Tax=Cannabis sativa TaxID=3483 RepID=A0A803QRY7_CANSA
VTGTRVDPTLGLGQVIDYWSGLAPLDPKSRSRLLSLGLWPQFSSVLCHFSKFGLGDRDWGARLGLDPSSSGPGFGSRLVWVHKLCPAQVPSLNWGPEARSVVLFSTP